jgi:hypothetical protein
LFVNKRRLAAKKLTKTTEDFKMNSRKNIGIRPAVFVLVLVLTMAVSAIGDTHYVSPGQSIQAAIDDANDGDQIEVAAGTYYEAINFNGKAVRLYSSGPEVTTIDANGAYHVVQCVSGEDANTILEGFTITGGNASGTDSNSSGGGMYNDQSSPTVTNCIFSVNTAGSSGGGMYNYNNSSPTVTNCTFENNQAQEVSTNYGGGGMCNSNSNPVVTYCTFSGNSAGRWGGGMYNDSSSPVVTNCTFNGNTAYTGAGMFNQTSGPMLNMCTFSGNSAGGSGGGMFNYTTSSPTVTNCAFSDNSADWNGGGMANVESSTPTVTNCTFSGNAAQNTGGGIDNENNSSPTVTNCILWGDTPNEIYNNSSTPIVTYSDVEGGTSESWFGAGCIDTDPLFVDAAGGNWRLSDWSPCVDAGNNNDVPGGVMTDLDGNPRFVDDTGAADTGAGTAPIVDMGAFERQMSSVKPIYNVTRGLYYWQVQAAIDDANDGDEIEAAPGTYNEAINFSGKAIRLYSSGGRAVTTIDGTGASHVVQCTSGEGAGTILEGFTITGGSANGFWPANCGGGMLNSSSSPTVTNCTFSGNTATGDGGGMYNFNSSPMVSNCTFSSNSAKCGGGMYNGLSRATVNNCEFSGNTADGSGTYDGGGGMYNNQSSPTVAGCSFSENEAKGDADYDGGGGMYNYQSSPTVIYCVFSDNESNGGGNDDGGGMYNYEGSPAVRGCTFNGNKADFGGGMYNNQESSPTVTSCKFTGNSATTQDGGGMGNYNSSSPKVTNCVFLNNDAGDVGGAMQNSYSEPYITNCTFSGNSAARLAGGMRNHYGTPVVTNCILWGDTPDEIYGSSGTVTYSDVQGGWPGTKNIDALPKFVNTPEGPLHLGPQSPCVDAGNNLAILNVNTDLAGDPRLVDDANVPDTGMGIGTLPIVDMGAYERQEDSAPIVYNAGIAYWTIQEAIDEAEAGDIIEVLPGTCTEAINFKGKAITLRSTNPNDPDVVAATIINATGLDSSVVTCDHGENANTILEGFTITGGNATNGGGMYNSSSSPKVTNCIFSVNTASERGGGMYNVSSSPTVTYCTFSNNKAINYDGGGMYNREDSRPTVKYCTFSLNTANWGGGMYNHESRPMVTNCTFSNNEANIDGGGLYNRYLSRPAVRECTFIDNRADYGGGLYNYLSGPTVTNCSFTGNSATEDGGGMGNYHDSDPTVTNCLFFSNYAGDVGGAMLNNTSSVTITNCTFSGNSAARVTGGIRNFESTLVLTNCILWGDTQDEIYGSATAKYCDIQGWTGGGTGNINSNPLFVNSTRGDFRLVSFRSPCVDAGLNAVPGLPATDLAGNPRIVDGDENGTVMIDMGAYEFNGGPVRNLRLNGSYLSIQAAIDDAGTGDEIEAGPGTYYEAINFEGKAIRLYSSGGPAVTTIDGTGNYHVVQCVNGEDSNTVLDGFTITGGKANGLYLFDKYGGGMFNVDSSPTVTNCIFSGNAGQDSGGGMCNHTNSSPTLTNCTFRYNSTDQYGGGMYNYINSNPTVSNCTFSNNSVEDDGGGMYNYYSSPTVTNCILWGDMPNEIVDTSGSASVVTYSDVKGGWSGEGNIEQNPLLRNAAAGDLSLAPWSPCIDTGNNDVVAGSSIDITGQPRLVDGDCDSTVTVDMGAHEFRHAYGGDFDSSCLVNMADFAFLAWAWLASPLSENWDPVCDISIPADGSIDAGDLKVLTGNWLLSVDTPITCEPNRLKDEFGLDALCAAAILSAAPCAYSPNDLAQTLYDVGYSAAGAYRALTQVCGMTDIFRIEQILYDVGYPPEEYIESTALSFVRKFAPVLYFDRAHKGLPMSAQVYFETMMSPRINSPYPGQITWTTPWDGPCGKPGVIRVPGRDESNCGMHNNDLTPLTNGEVPTYYKVISDIDSDVPTGPKGRLRIAYWWFYGFQRYCNSVVCDGSSGEHHGDWEYIIVTTDPDRSRADAVTYGFHGDWYTRQWGGFDRVGDRPVVYVGKVGHGCYHGQGNQGFGDDGISLWPYYCCEYADWRDPTENSKWYNAYDNLVSLRGSEPWMLADRIGSLYEYYGVEFIISHWRWGPHISYKGWWCKWVHLDACGNHPTIAPFDWTISSCDGVGCGTSKCEGEIDKDYDEPAYYNEGWPWEGGSMGSAAEPVSLARGSTMASCGSCGVSRFGAFVRLGDYWLATP